MFPVCLSVYDPEAGSRLAVQPTNFCTTYRLSTVKSADEILVLEAGQVIERGDHATLLSKHGKYADMWERQARSANLKLAAE